MNNEKRKELLSYGFEKWFVDAFQPSIETVVEEDLMSCGENSTEFEKKCRDAAEKAYIVNCMRERYKLRESSPLSFVNLFVKLTEECQISMRKFATAILVDIFSFTPNYETIKQIDDFTRRIGMTTDELILSLRIWLAESMDYFLPDHSLARGRGDECMTEWIEKELEKIERKYSEKEKMRYSELMENVGKLKFEE